MGVWRCRWPRVLIAVNCRKTDAALSGAEVADLDRTFLAVLGPLAVVGRVVGGALGGRLDVPWL